ncbi:hypothetical protein ACJZ2D_010440 [Fusarium nematophilum]
MEGSSSLDLQQPCAGVRVEMALVAHSIYPTAKIAASHIIWEHLRDEGSCNRGLRGQMKLPTGSPMLRNVSEFGAIRSDPAVDMLPPYSRKGPQQQSLYFLAIGQLHQLTFAPLAVYPQGGVDVFSNKYLFLATEGFPGGKVLELRHTWTYGSRHHRIFPYEGPRNTRIDGVF